MLICVKDGVTLEIGCPTALTRDFLTQRHSQQIKTILDRLSGKNFSVTFLVLPKKTNDHDVARGPLFAPPTNGSSLPKPYETKSSFETNLFPRKTFDNFIVGASNQMAHAAACAVAKSPGNSYNPLFVYGGVGVGKTHLLHAMGNAMLKNNPIFKVSYTTCEKFTNEFVENLSEHKIKNFRAKYRKLDCLIIDDIQGISGRVQTQEEFFHTFNELMGSQNQIIIASDRHPKELSKLTDRLVSRFLGGLICDIGMPDFETRLGILKEKCQEKKIYLAPEILDFLAFELVGSPRELEGAIFKLLTLTNLKNEGLTIARVKELFGQKSIPIQNVSPKDAVSRVASYFNLKTKDLTSSKRTKELVLARQLASYLLKTDFKLTLKKIGDILGKRDHSTILYGVEKIASLLETDTSIKKDLLLIRENFFTKESFPQKN